MSTPHAVSTPATQTTQPKTTVRVTIDLTPTQHAILKSWRPRSGHTTLAAWTRALWLAAIRDLKHPNTSPAYMAGYAAGQADMQAAIATAAVNATRARAVS